MRNAEEILDTYEYVEHDGETVSIYEDLIHGAMNEYRMDAFAELLNKMKGGARNSITIEELNKFIKEL